MWRVLFLSLILSSFQMIILPSSDVDKRGWDSAHSAIFCKEILRSGHSKGDGEYWIDPEKSGNPLRVYCDMSRYGNKRISFFLETKGLKPQYVWLGALSIRTFWSWLFVLSLQRSLLCFLIETVTKFSNVIGYHQPADLSTTRQYTRDTFNWTV